MAVNERWRAAYTTITLGLLWLTTVAGRVLTPPYFNLAVSANISASATCGIGSSGPELYCKLTGANRANREDYELIQGQLCDFCHSWDPHRPSRHSHPPEYAIDGTENWWQSPPLSRGLEYNEVNLTINLGQEYHVAYVFIKMANSPRPGVFVLERSKDGGRTFQPWQYFADSPSECHNRFNKPANKPIEKDDDVICTTHYSSIVPLEGGEIVVSLVNGRPSSKNFSYSETLQDWTKSDSIRIRLLRTRTLLGHLMAVARQTPTVTRRYFYSIKDISIGGRCVCNGHADVCDVPNESGRLQCRCQHNTMGPQCSQCAPGFVAKPWRPATLISINACEPCQCFGHSAECVYNETVARNGESLDIHGQYKSGGVCLNCRDNTKGINCHQCVPGYYRPPSMPLDSPHVCQPCSCDLRISTGECEADTGRCKCRKEFMGDNCDQCSLGYFDYPNCRPCECDINGTHNGVCSGVRGQCPCKPNYDGVRCDQCGYGYYGFPHCKPCQCNSLGAVGTACDIDNGQCRCRPNFGGRDCSECAPGFHNYPSCVRCDCDVPGCKDDSICEPDTGKCICKENFAGLRCERCNTGYYKHPDCLECGCQLPGSKSSQCDPIDGACSCHDNFSGDRCDRCAIGYYDYPNCKPCMCNEYGTMGGNCDESGQCICGDKFTGTTCDQCKPNLYNFPQCEECNCNPAGAKDVPGHPLGGCGSGMSGALCECKQRITGRLCDTCRTGFWNLNINNLQGCEDCSCYRPGTLGGSSHCHPVDGQCPCKTFTDGRICDMCMDGTYNLKEDNVFGCQDCNCDVGGAVDHSCQKDGGQCSCRANVVGRSCDTPVEEHFYPTLYHQQHELEDGYTDRATKVRYDFQSEFFPEFSWKGYAIFSRLQQNVMVDVRVVKPALYRLVFRYVNRLDHTVAAKVSVVPEDTSEQEQGNELFFKASRKPTFTEVQDMMLNPGRWTVKLSTSENVFVDYFVLLPQAYYEASILQAVVNTPCSYPLENRMCKHYSYVPPDDDVTAARAVDDATAVAGTDDAASSANGDEDELGLASMAHLNSAQTTLLIKVDVPKKGKYVFVVQYYSPKPDRIDEVDVGVESPGVANEEAILRLASCKFSSLCRQVVTDDKQDAKAFEVNGDFAKVTFTAPSDVDLAIEMIIAVPLDKWKLGYIKPGLVCVRRDKDCIDSTFETPSGAKKTEFETGINIDRVEINMPEHIIDQNIKIIKSDGKAPAVTVKGETAHTGTHKVLVNYFQPYHVGFDVNLEITTSGTMNKGKFYADYCPGVGGCRAEVVLPENALSTKLLQFKEVNFIVRLHNPTAKSLWVDYILPVPIRSFKPEVMNIEPVDMSVEFINHCAQDHFYIDPKKPISEFCRSSVFSLTSDYNNGALPCNCDKDGSYATNCENFGGQCQCKPNVIGRTCSQCATGFFGFPDCQKCDCPSGLCDPLSGRCVCPPLVTGANCDTCLPHSFGFDRLIGCEDCGCKASGVVSGKLECEATSGQCECKDNVAGRTCDRCENGYFRHPDCYECRCDRSGAKEEICDQQNGACNCKDNVVGSGCERCQQGTFYLEKRNPLGCTKCFCFDMTRQCHSSSLRRDVIKGINGWGVSNLKTPVINVVEQSATVKVEQDNVQMADLPLYWVAPTDYLGNKVTSYGGMLQYSVMFDIDQTSDSSGIVASDVRMEGANMTIEHINQRQPDVGENLEVKLDILERNFVHVSTGAPVTREQFLMILSRLEALNIRASFYSEVTVVRLSNVSLDIATRSGPGELALNVEQCLCPPNFRGPSCEQCADGFYRQKNGHPSGQLGICVPCNCHGRADSCDPDTGICQNCRHNYGGPQCLYCKEGYYYDRRTDRCEICTCPMAIDSNNFATTCQVYSTGEIYSCACKEGYSGTRCEVCAPGYHGNPEEIGGGCKRCECNNNLDMRNPLSCDPMTGECLLCINNSTGDTCERCQDWYHGDAIDAKNCAPCSCHQTGSKSCDYVTGGCTCHDNVEGLNCDHCAPNTFGFESGKGCEPCDCGLASESVKCDPITGQCPCREGTSGRRCEQCTPGYYDYGLLGCKKCDCEGDGAIGCDPVTGQCTCLPGVAGPNCDQCAPRWAIKEGEGCVECDSCVHLLLDDLDLMEGNATSSIKELDSVSVGQRAFRRLADISEDIKDLSSLVKDLDQNPSDFNPLKPLLEKLDDVEAARDVVLKKANRAKVTSESNVKDAKKSKEDSAELSGIIRMGAEAAKAAVDFAKKVLEEIVNSIRNKNTSKLVKEAEDLLQEMKERDFIDKDDAAEEELQMAKDALAKAKTLKERAQEQANNTRDIENFVDQTEEKLLDLMNNSRHSMGKSRDAGAINRATEQAVRRVGDLLNQLANNHDMTNNTLDMTRQLLRNSSKFLEHAAEDYQAVDEDSSRLESALRSLKKHIDDLIEGSKGLRPLVDNATEHAMKLQMQAQELDTMLADTRESAANALKASKAYQDIVDSIEGAINMSKVANAVSEKALQLSNGLSDKAKESLDESLQRKDDASMTKADSDGLKPTMKSAKGAADRLEKLNKDVKEGLEDVLIDLENLPDGGYDLQAREAADKAILAEDKAKEAQNKVKKNIDRIEDDKKRAKEISDGMNQARLDLDKAQSQVDKVKELVPNFKNLVDKLKKQSNKTDQVGEDLTAEIQRLRETIALARGEAARIRVGVEFFPNTSLQLRNPKNLKDAGSYSRLSFFFKTTQPNAMLAYVGPAQSKVQDGDFMAVEIVNSRLVFRYDLGAGIGSISIDRDVADNKWHEAIAERTGKSGKLTLRTKGVSPNDISEGESPGTYTVLDLSPHTAKFFIGGMPPGTALDRTKMANFDKSIVGSVEDVKFDGIPVGMWDFVDGRNNNKGAPSRDVLLESPINGFRFESDGWVVLPKQRFKPEKASMISFRFKTYNPNGLILFAKGDNDVFISLEMKNGKVLYQYNLGSGKAQILSKSSFNDGDWHTVMANRLYEEGLLKIDGRTENSGRSLGTAEKLMISDDIYVGGYRGLHGISGVTNKGFDGCIKDVTFGSTLRDINDNNGAKSVLPGCPEIARIVSFGADQSKAFIAMSPISVESKYQITMKVKTLEKDGILFYNADDRQENSFSVSLDSGKIVVMVNSANQRTRLDSRRDNYNDARWHYVTITKNGRDLELDIDEDDQVESKASGQKILPTTSLLYFGGVPDSYGLQSDNVASAAWFKGCIGDVTINGNFVNFAHAPLAGRGGASLAGCPLPDPDPVTSAPTAPPATKPPPGKEASGDQPRGTAGPTPAPPPTAQCALPLRPKNDVTPGPNAGMRFEGSPNARAEFSKAPVAYNIKSDIGLSFKTTDSDGVLFYAADDSHKHYISLHMKNGYLHFTYNLGEGAAELKSDYMYDDGDWHEVVLQRRKRKGILKIDGVEVMEKRSPGVLNTLEVFPPFYLGGLSPAVAQSAAATILDGVTSSFTGCVRALTLNELPFGAPSFTEGARACPAGEKGMFVSADGGYLELTEKFNVGLDLTIEVQIKPRTTSGVIVSVAANEDNYLVLQLVDGKVVFNVNNGDGEFKTVFEFTGSAAENSICDGQWHWLLASKTKNVITLEVDGARANYPGVGGSSTDTTTNDPLYIGGVPARHVGIKNSQQYVGCIRNLEFGGQKQDLSSGTTFGGVNLNQCPTN